MSKQFKMCPSNIVSDYIEPVPDDIQRKFFKLVDNVLMDVVFSRLEKIEHERSRPSKQDQETSGGAWVDRA